MLKSSGLKLGVIGAGVMGKNHARVASLLPGVSLVGIAESDQEQAKTLPDIFQSIIYYNYKDLLTICDAVCLATPTTTHFTLVQEFLSAGKHVLIEKPFTGKSEQAKELANLAKAQKLVLAVGLIERFNPAFAELAKLIKGEKIIGIDIKRFSPYPARISDTNVIFDMMIHDLDLLLSLLPKEEIETLRAAGKKTKSSKLDQVEATLFFHSGIMAKVSADRDCDSKTRKITVTTEKALYEADLLNKKTYIRDLITHVPTAHHTRQQDQLTAEIFDFVKAIKNGTMPKVSAADGYNALRLAEEVEKACS